VLEKPSPVPDRSGGSDQTYPAFGFAREVGIYAEGLGSWDRQSLMLRLKELEDEVHRSRLSQLYVLTQLLDLKDMNIGRHCTRLAEWAVRIAADLGLEGDERRNVEVASLLHDVGKVGVPDAILGKNGPLDRSEWEEMKRHPDYGWNLLRLLPGLESASLYVLHHHERIDGRGYPGGLKGDQIPLGGRIVAVVDAFDAMISDRCYRPGLAPEVAIERLEGGSGRQFDPEVVNRFVKLASTELVDVLEATDGSEPSSPRP
jgi:HD-GYP domain-containing protein (c-di-GMP phosphodiesterase class II)